MIRSGPPYRMTFKIVKDDFDNIKDHMHRIGDFWHYHEDIPNNPKWRTTSKLDVTHQKLWHFLNGYDYRDKSHASADKIIEAIPERLRHYWWRGYFDGDGCFAKNPGGRVCFNSGYDQDWTFVYKLGELIGVTFALERHDRGSRAGSKMNLTNYVHLKKLADYIYAGETFGLTRKRDKYLSHVTGFRKKPDGATSQYMGVSTSKRRKGFVMQVSCDGVYHNRLFENEVDAAREYDRLATRFFGDRAMLNFPND
jgi:hypothetical protein